jgi:hypothetical protein
MSRRTRFVLALACAVSFAACANVIGISDYENGDDQDAAGADGSADGAPDSSATDAERQDSTEIDSSELEASDADVGDSSEPDTAFDETLADGTTGDDGLPADVADATDSVTPSDTADATVISDGACGALNTPQHCLACANACDTATSYGAGCNGTTGCTYSACKSGFGNCVTAAPDLDGCETALNSVLCSASRLSVPLVAVRLAQPS